MISLFISFPKVIGKHLFKGISCYGHILENVSFIKRHLIKWCRFIKYNLTNRQYGSLSFPVGISSNENIASIIWFSVHLIVPLRLRSKIGGISEISK